MIPWNGEQSWLVVHYSLRDMSLVAPWLFATGVISRRPALAAAGMVTTSTCAACSITLHCTSTRLGYSTRCALAAARGRRRLGRCGSDNAVWRSEACH
jgi:hypothetical protein